MVHKKYRIKTGLWLREKNQEASIITTPWDEINAKNILEAMEKVNSLEKDLLEEHHHHDGECCHHDGHHHDGECCHHDGHRHDGECCHHEEHHHDGECCHHEEHHHDGERCHHEHGHHHADDVFTSIGIETAHRFTEEELKDIIQQLANSKEYGEILRAKGIVAADEGEWFHFDLVPEETEIRRGAADFTGRICVIGSALDEAKVKELFYVA